MVLLSAVIILVFLIVIIHLRAIISFREERRYIMMEIRRSTDEDKYRYWKRKLKKLYCRSIPVIGRFIK